MQLERKKKKNKGRAVNLQRSFFGNRSVGVGQAVLHRALDCCVVALSELVNSRQEMGVDEKASLVLLVFARLLKAVYDFSVAR